MSVHTPERPAVADYPTSTPHQAELEQARAFFLRELESPEDEWEDQGEREDVHLWSKKDANVRFWANRALPLPLTSYPRFEQDPCAHPHSSALALASDQVADTLLLQTPSRPSKARLSSRTPILKPFARFPVSLTSRTN